MIILPQLTGKSDSKWSGVKYSVAEMIGIDIHSTPGLIKVHQKLAKDSGDTVTDFCKVSVACSTGDTYWFSSTSGKIWKRTSAGSWGLEDTATAAAGGVNCLGAKEFNGYIYWATESRLHRIAIGDLGDWAANSVENWATFSKTDASFHPMAIVNKILFIGDGNYVASVNSAGTFADGSTGQANTLDINTPHRIKALIDFDIDLLVGTYVADEVNKAEIIRWDTDSDSWTTTDPIEENGINAFIRDDNYVYVQAGKYGRIYFYDGEKLVPYKRIPGTWSPTSYGEVYPQSVATHLTIPVFGFSNGSGNPCNQGVYSFGSYSKDYPKILDLSYPISAAALTSIEVGAILAVGADLFVAWKSGATYGVDKLDWSNKYTLAYFETMMLFQNKRDKLKVLEKVFALYETLPASTAITFYSKKNHGAYSSALTSITDAIRMKVYAESGLTGIGALQIKVAFTVNNAASANAAPTIEAIGIDLK